MWHQAILIRSIYIDDEKRRFGICGNKNLAEYYVGPSKLIIFFARCLFFIFFMIAGLSMSLGLLEYFLCCTQDELTCLSIKDTQFAVVYTKIVL